LHQRRGLLGSHMRQWMLPYDVLVTPTVSSTAFAHRAPGSVPMSPGSMLGWTPYSYPFNLTQQPALTIPCGLSDQGLPIGMQLVGRMFDDMTVLRVAAAFEACMPIPRPVL
jgi:aspartyl-tRNA(Asn)/glutamyl-tRNA(Gln) amidotransferase subunit A